MQPHQLLAPAARQCTHRHASPPRHPPSPTMLARDDISRTRTQVPPRGPPRATPGAPACAPRPIRAQSSRRAAAPPPAATRAPTPQPHPAARDPPQRAPSGRRAAPQCAGRASVTDRCTPRRSPRTAPALVPEQRRRARHWQASASAHVCGSMLAPERRCIRERAATRSVPRELRARRRQQAG